MNDLGHHYKASQLLTQAAEAEFGKNDYEIIFSAASAYRQAKHYSEAEKYYKRAVELKPKVSDFMIFNMHDQSKKCISI